MSHVAFAEAEGGTTGAARSRSGDGAKRLLRRWICCEIASLRGEANGQSQLKIFQKTRKFPFDQNANTHKHVSSDSPLEKQRRAERCTCWCRTCSRTGTLGCYRHGCPPVARRSSTGRPGGRARGWLCRHQYFIRSGDKLEALKSLVFLHYRLLPSDPAAGNPLHC